MQGSKKHQPPKQLLSNRQRLDALIQEGFKEIKVQFPNLTRAPLCDLWAVLLIPLCLSSPGLEPIRGGLGTADPALGAGLYTALCEDSPIGGSRLPDSYPAKNPERCPRLFHPCMQRSA